MNIILFDGHEARQNFFPLTLTRPIADLRVGIVTLKEKWELLLKASASFLTDAYLQKKFPAHFSGDNIYIDATIIPDETIVSKILSLSANEGLAYRKNILALRTPAIYNYPFLPENNYKFHEYDGEIIQLRQLWDIFGKNGEEIKKDFKLLTEGRKGMSISDPHTRVYNNENIFIEEGVDIKAAIINAETGPVYIGKSCIIQEGSIIRGPFAMLEGAHLNMGSKMRGDTTIGPYCKVGGEVSNVVFWGYSNKAHDGFLGNSVVGEWCNFGADTNTSNMKNDYGNVKLYNYLEKKFIDSGRQFCGLIMGDHSKAAINTMFNTGTVVGVNCNIFGEGFPEKFVPSFSWGVKNFEKYKIEKAFEVARLAMERRGRVFDDMEILNFIYQNG